MPEPHHDESTPATRLDLALAEYARRIDAGEQVDREAFVAEYVELVDRLRACLAASDQAERLGDESGPPRKALADAPTLPPDAVERVVAPETVVYNDEPAPRLPRGIKVRYFGDYELLEEIARGGMGVVYKARQTKLNRLVAIKMILAGQLASADDVKRFHTEAEAAANLQHPNIVAIHEVGEHEGQHYFSMDYVEGRSLADLVRDHSPSARLAAEYVRSIAQAIQYAHERGTLHRDLKPSNVLIDRQGQPRVTDFGLARRIEGGSELTGTGQILGTRSYMPPEQAAGNRGEVGPGSDVYSLGAILYELVAGRPPFRAETPLDTLLQVLEQNPVTPRLLNPKLPRDLETICLKCLRKEPVKRYSTAAALAADLGRWLDGKPIVARRVSRRERAWLWCKRRPAVAALSAAVVIISVVGSLVAVEGQNAVRADGLVNSLINADVAQVPQIVAELENHRGRVTPMLEALASAEPKTVEERKVQLHARLALVTHDEQQVLPLVEELLTANVSYLGVIRDQLAPYKQRFEGDLWELLHDGTKDPARRSHAGLALATYATASEQWTPADNAFLVEQLVAANPEHQPRLREYLRPLVIHLLVDLERSFADRKATEGHRLSAANAFADYAGSDIPKLSQLLAVATPQQHAVLYGIVAATPAPSTVEDLGKIAATQPPADLGSVERVPFGQRRANAAVTLLRLGEREKVLPVFDMTDDPEALTQFIFRCRERGIGAEALLDCLQRLSDAPQDRYPRHARYALLLALGEFSLDEIPASRREALLRQLADWYRQDPSSGVHGAAGWLLRQWGQAEVARQVDQTAVPYAPDREWFTLAITVAPTAPPKPPEEPAENRAATEPPEKDAAKPDESGKPAPPEEETKPKPAPEPPPKTFYYTFIVFPAGDYEIGSVNDEPDRNKNEGRHPVKLTRPFALLDREITWEELIAFKPMYAGFIQQFDAKPADAGFGADWYDAVGFCRWLGQQSGLSEGDQSYADPETLDKAQYPREPNPVANWAPRNWPLELGRRGFRLPTESEWEVASRAGTRTTYGFGSEASLLRRFGWFAENSGKRIHPPRELRPSVRGLFDMHGNQFEWTHDWFGDYGVEAMIDPLGAKEDSDRVNRGGGWGFDPALCRSACRNTVAPSFHSIVMGFRVALSPSGVTPEAGSVKGAEPSGGGTEGEKWFQRGLTRAKKGDLDGAIADWTKAIEINSANDAAYTFRGTARNEKGDLDGAIADYTKAIDINPRNETAYYNRGGHRKAKGDLDGAIADYTKAIGVNPRNDMAYYNRGMARGDEGDLDGAIADFTKAIEINPRKDEGYNNRGNVLLNKGDLDGAIADCSEAIQINPRNGSAYHNRGLALLLRGMDREAEADFEKALSLWPDLKPSLEQAVREIKAKRARRP